ncbi:MAG: insulinase family protein [Oscillospiraceae bacterium]|nr:insulinase family protein [Oscillospiraceae bacterium]
MTDRLKREEILPSVFFNSFTDGLYKSNRISINLFMPLSRDKAAKHALLTGVLAKSSKKYPSLQSLNKKLYDLYGAGLVSDVSKIGESQSVTLHLLSVANRFALEGENVLSASADFLCETLLEPNISGGAFIPEEVEIERARLIDLIESQINDKRSYAIHRCSELLCEGENYAIPRCGYTEDAEKISPEELYQTYRELLAGSRIEIFHVGSDDSSDVKALFKSRLSVLERRPDRSIVTMSAAPRVCRPPKNISENMDVTQAKLVLGFAAEESKSARDSVAMLMAMMIYGILPSSKLFRNVREKLGLCYYCTARYDRYKSVVFVDSGIEAANRERAAREIIAQLEEIKNGEFADKDIREARLALRSSYRGVFDEARLVESYYMGNIMSGFDKEPEEMAAFADEIGREEIINACRGMKLGAVYCLEGRGVSA